MDSMRSKAKCCSCDMSMSVSVLLLQLVLALHFTPLAAVPDWSLKSATLSWRQITDEVYSLICRRACDAMFGTKNLVCYGFRASNST